MNKSVLVLPAPELSGQDGNPLEVQLNWSHVAGAKEYVLQRTSGAGETYVDTYRGPERLYKEVPARSTGIASWRYRVRAEAPGRVGSWSHPLELHTGF